MKNRKKLKIKHGKTEKVINGKNNARRICKDPEEPRRNKRIKKDQGPRRTKKDPKEPIRIQKDPVRHRMAQ